MMNKAKADIGWFRGNVHFLFLLTILLLTLFLPAGCVLAEGVSTENESAQEMQSENISTEAGTESAPEEETELPLTLAPDFTLPDQFGQEHTLSDYQGKVVFLNFWATWCPPCRAEMPDIQALYERYEDSEDVAVLGVAFPGLSGEGTADEVAAFLEENGYTYPVVMAEDAQVAWDYQIQAFPTTFMITRDGDIYGYVTGSLEADMMDSIIEQTLAYSDGIEQSSADPDSEEETKTE